VPGYKPTVPGEQRLGRHQEAAPARAGEEATQRRQEGTVGGLVGRTSHLTSQHDDLVAQGQQLDLVGPFRPHQDDDKLEHMAKSEVDEGPKPATHPVPPHPADGSRRRLASKAPARACDWVFGPYEV